MDCQIRFSIFYFIQLCFCGAFVTFVPSKSLDPNDRSTRDARKEHDKFAAARDLLRKFNHACSKAMQCGVNICFDEVGW